MTSVAGYVLASEDDHKIDTNYFQIVIVNDAVGCYDYTASVTDG